MHLFTTEIYVHIFLSSSFSDFPPFIPSFFPTFFPPSLPPSLRSFLPFFPFFLFFWEITFIILIVCRNNWHIKSKLCCVRVCVCVCAYNSYIGYKNSVQSLVILQRRWNLTEVNGYALPIDWGHWTFSNKNKLCSLNYLDYNLYLIFILYQSFYIENISFHKYMHFQWCFDFIFAFRKQLKMRKQEHVYIYL